MTSGAVVAIIAMLFMEITAPRRKRLRVDLNEGALPELSEFLRGFASSSGWNEAGQNRIALVGEETLNSLLAEPDVPEEPADSRRLIVAAHSVGREIELEFIAASDGDNLEDQLSYLGETPDIADDREISFRLLRHYASAVRHQKYHGVDVVTVNVERAA